MLHVKDADILSIDEIIQLDEDIESFWPKIVEIGKEVGIDLSDKMDVVLSIREDAFIEPPEPDCSGWTGERVDEAIESVYCEYKYRKIVRNDVISAFYKIKAYLLEAFRSIELNIDYVFRKEGDVWVVGLERPATICTDYKGMSYIHHLLQYPNKPISVKELSDLLSKPDTTGLRNKGKLIEYNPDSGEQEGVSENSGQPQNIADKQAIKKFQKELDDIEYELAEAVKNNDIGKVEQLQIKKDELKERLIGSNDTFTTDVEQARKAVSNAIRKAIKNIETHRQDLFQHLNNSIQTGINCTYTPENNITWEL
jgi:hypothetical protein